MNIFEKEINQRIMKSIPGLKDIHDNPQEGEICFEFNNQEINLNDKFIQSSDESELVSLIKSMRVPYKELKTAVTKETNIVIHANVLGLNQRYSRSEIEDLPEVMQERAKAEQWLRKARSVAKKHSISSQSSTLKASKSEVGQLAEQVERLRVGLADNKDENYQNKWGETVNIRDILNEGKKVGAIEYLESDNTVTILRADVDADYRGKGIGFNAYKEFINEKVSFGKRVGSDNILSESAQRVYEKLENEGYYLMESPTYLLARGDITSITREDRIQQRKEMPTERVNGAIMTSGGYRMKGESIYTVFPSDSIVSSNKIRIESHDLSSGDSTNLLITPSYVEKSKIEDDSNSLNQDVYNEIEELLFAASNELLHPDNQSIAESLAMKNVLVWNVTRISHDNLYELNKKINPEIEYNGPKY